MGFLSVMKAIGLGSLRAFGVAAPLVSAMVPKADPFIAEVIAVVGTTERVVTALKSNATGADKAAASLPLVVEALKASELVSGHHIADTAQFQKACQLYIDATVALMNSLEHKG